MTDKELKQLNRVELLEMLLVQMEENERLKQSLEEIQAALEKRRIIIEQAGNLAEAVLKLNGVFESAEQAVKQYLENVQGIAPESSEVQ